MKPCGMRPVCPKSVVLYQVGAGMVDATDTKWFNRKEFVFTIQGNLKDKCQYDSAVAMQPLAFAAVDQQGYDAWRRFFAQQQQSLQSRASGVYGQPVVMLNQQQQFSQAAAAMPYTHQQQQQFPPATVAHGGSESKTPPPPPAVLSASTAAMREQEEEDIRRAIWLSLQTTGNGHRHAESEQLASSPPLPVSAPDWDEIGDATDEDSQHSASSGGSAAADSASATGQAAAAPVVNFGPAPSYAGIGECVICFDGPQAAVCVPCGHNAICMSCAEEILDTTCECPVCRRPIRELIKLYRV